MASSAPKPFSIALSAKTSVLSSSSSSTRKEPPLKSNKRRLAALGSDDDDSDDDSHHRGKVQLVSGFNHARGGALDASGEEKKKAAPLVIPALSNRDWRREAELRSGARKAIYIPEEAKQRGKVKEEDVKEVDNTGEGETYGLQTFEKKAIEAADADDEQEEASTAKELTEDERAIAALMGTEKKGSNLVIAHTSGTTDWRNGKPDGNEDDAYRKDVDARPDVPTLADYAAVPVEEFGAALLRGMGWKGGEELGGKGKQPGDKSGKLRLLEKRPAFLGIGAKPMAEIPELGAWGKGDKKGGRRPDTTYIPVVKIDKRTGNVVDESESGERTGSEKPSEVENGPGKPRSHDLEYDESGRGDRRDGRHDKDSRGRDNGRRRDRSSDRSGRDKDRHREGGRDRSSDRKDRHRDGGRDRSPDRSVRGKGRHRDSGRDRDRDRDRDRRRDRDCGRDSDRRKRSRDRDYEKRDRR